MRQHRGNAVSIDNQLNVRVNLFKHNHITVLYLISVSLQFATLESDDSKRLRVGTLHRPSDCFETTNYPLVYDFLCSYSVKEDGPPLLGQRGRPHNCIIELLELVKAIFVILKGTP